jgi:hypothetical protein
VRKSRFSEEQIIGLPKEAEGGGESPISAGSTA